MRAQAEARRSSRRFRWGLLGVAALAAAVRVAYVLVVVDDIALGADATWYLLQAGNLGNGDGYVDPAAFYGAGEAVPTANFPPLWPGLAAVLTWAGAESAQSAQLLGAAVGAATAAAAALLGRAVAGPAVGLVAGVLVAVSPSLTAGDGSLMADGVFALLVTAGLLLLVRDADRSSPRRWLAAGLVLGLATLARSDGVLVGAVLLGGLALLPGTVPRRRRLGGAALGAAVLLAAVAPWTVWSSARLDGPVLLSSNGGSVLEGANCEVTYRGPELGRWSGTCLRFTRKPGLDELEWSREARQAGIDHARDHASRLPVVAAVRGLRVLGAYDPLDQARAEAEETRSAPWQVLAWWCWAATAAAAAVGAVVLGRRGVAVGPLLLPLAGAVVVAVTAWGNQRFRLVAEPAVLVLAAASFVALVSRWPLGPPVRRRAGAATGPAAPTG